MKKKGEYMRRNRTGFTFIEIMVVIILIGLLATLVAPKIFKGMGKAKASIARSKMAVVETALAQFHQDCGRLPTDAEQLDALLQAPEDVADKWNGPYIKKSELLDPWDNPYIYVEQGEHNVGSFDIVSLGADGQAGGDGENADIYND
jgi:general secretion pathway protein G